MAMILSDTAAESIMSHNLLLAAALDSTTNKLDILHHDAWMKQASLVGAAWVISSALFTTYSTTKFLKYNDPVKKTEDLPFTVDQLIHHDKDKRLPLLRTIQKSVESYFSLLSRPTVLTLFRFGGSLLLGLLAHPNLRIMERWQSVLNVAPQLAVPAVFLFLANWLNSVSLDCIGISLTYTSKCAIPLLTVLVTLFFDGPAALPNSRALVSLLPIALGIAAASWRSSTTPLASRRGGWLAAFSSATAQAILNVTSKRIMSRHGWTGAVAQRGMVAIGFLLTIVSSGVEQFMQREIRQKRLYHLAAQYGAATKPPHHHTPPPLLMDATPRQLPPTWLSLMAVAAYHVEYVLSFMFVKLVQPVTYSTCDALRRLCIIIAGRVMFTRPVRDPITNQMRSPEPLTVMNVIGMALALVGAVAYSVASVPSS